MTTIGKFNEWKELHEADAVAAPNPADAELLKKACKNWGYLSDAAKAQFKEYSKSITKGGPFDMGVACSVDSKYSIASEADRTLLNSLLTLSFLK